LAATNSKKKREIFVYIHSEEDGFRKEKKRTRKKRKEAREGRGEAPLAMLREWERK